MHHIECYGLVDRDYLDEDQLSAYKEKGIFAPRVSEVENLLLVSNVVQAVADQLLLNPNDVLEQIKQYVFDVFEREIPAHSLESTRYKVALLMGQFSSGQSDVGGYVADLSDFTARLDAQAIHDSVEAVARTIWASRDYDGVLRIFNRKAMVKSVDRFFNIRGSAYVDKVIEMATRGKGNIREHMMEFLPDIEACLP